MLITRHDVRRTALMGKTLGLAAILVLGCGGGTVSPDSGPGQDSGMDSAMGAECMGQHDGSPCGASVSMICIAGACAMSQCGDRFVDTRAGEQCDDGNSASQDGCEPGTCQFSCE